MRKSLFALLLLMPLIFSQPSSAANSEKNFGGVGIDGLPRGDGEIDVHQLVAGAPAAAAGILKGDVITAIDGKKTRGSDFKEMVNHRLRGRAGTKVLVSVYRPSTKERLKFNLIRRQLLLKK